MAKLMTAKQLEKLSDEKLTNERQIVDGAIEELRAYKKTIQTIFDRRDVEEKMKKLGLSPAQLVHVQDLAGVGAIESEEASGAK